MILGLLANLITKQLQTILNLLKTLRLQLLLHVVQTVKKLKQPNKTTNNLDLQKTLLLCLILRKVVIRLRNLSYEEDLLFNLKRHLQILLFNLHEHTR